MIFFRPCDIAHSRVDSHVRVLDGLGGVVDSFSGVVDTLSEVVGSLSGMTDL